MTVLQEVPATVFPEAGEHVADRPAESRGAARDDVRLLVARPGGLSHRRFADLADELDPGDLVVVNNSATVAGQVDVVRRAGTGPGAAPGHPPRRRQLGGRAAHRALGRTGQCSAPVPATC